jgi:hypothetical protein
MQRLFLGIFLILTCFSCKKEENTPDGDYLIFGHFYGECIGEQCVETFKITDEGLFEDSTDSYAQNEPFDFVPLSNDLFEQISGLENAIPAELLASTEDTFGCPDCADQGGIYIAYMVDCTVRKWRIDQDTQAVPEYLHDFMEEVNDAIALING